MSDEKALALLLADALQQEAVWEGQYGPSNLRDLLPQAAAELRRLYWYELRVREHRDMLAAEITKLHVEVAKLQSENNRLREWHATAWNRGHAVGLNGLNTALRQMEEHRKSDAWGNTQLTEALLLAEEQRDELLAALKRIAGYDLPDEAEIVRVARAAIAKAEGEK